MQVAGNRFIWISTAALLIAAGTGCAKKTPVAAVKTPVAQTAAPVANTPANDTRRSEAPARATTSAPAQSNGMSQNERNSLNQSLARMEDVLFDYDKATIRPDAAKTLETDLTVIRTIMAKYPSQKVKIEGHADERGSDEYNVALGDRRAVAAKEFLAGAGVSASQLDIVSYGKQRPVCTDHNENCWQKNRRAHFVAEATN